MTMDYSQYDDFLRDAEKDERVGTHTFSITQKSVDAWGDGSPRYKFRGVLVTAGNAKCDWTASVPPPVEQLAGVTGGRKRGIALSISNLKALAGYKKTLDTLAEGDEISVETSKDKEGFVRVLRVLAPGAAAASTAAKDRVPGF